MIAYLPNIYPDELVYSWCCRYYAHSGLPSYSMALEDLFSEKSYRISYEFSGCFNSEAKAIIDKMIKVEDLIEEHTMFPYYGRFTPYARRTAAYDALINGERLGKLLPLSNSTEERFLMYCPVCATEDRKSYGEAYLHRIHQIRHIGVCHRHGCKLIPTGVRITANASPRLFVTEEVIPHNATSEIDPESSKLSLSRYMAEVFKQPISTSNTASIGDYLTYRLNGTPYMSTTGFMRQTAKLYRDMSERYNVFQYKQHHIEKVLIGQSVEPHLIILMAFHLGVTPQDLSTRSIPATYRIITRTREPSSYSTRKGTQLQDWNKLDKDNLPQVRRAIRRLHTDSTGRPRRVTLRAVCDTMGWPDKRLELLPLCKAEVKRYHETMPQYWAREIVWAYRKVINNQTKLNWRAIRDLTNMKRRDFLEALPLLIHYTDTETSTKIKSL